MAENTNGNAATDNGYATRLKKFLERNPDSELLVKDGKTAIIRPWADDTLMLRLWGHVDVDALIDVLNSVYLRGDSRPSGTPTPKILSSSSLCYR